ncbi:MAG: sigma-70 family RNA polymerase sigma factor [Vicinamibacterales bacterium]
MSDLRVTALDACDLAAAESDFAMDDASFAAFYEATARPLWRYLARTTGTPRLADDLLHEAYYRVLRARVAFESENHRRHYLFRVAANLVHDHRRRDASRPEVPVAAEADRIVDDASVDGGDRAAARVDLERAMARLTPRDRSLLWLAYVDGRTHEEIAAVHRVKRSSLKMLLARARTAGGPARRRHGAGTTMTLPTCPREADVVRAAMSGGWPAQADPALVEHAGHCAVCREAVLVSTLLQDAERDTEAPVPTAAQVWWRLAVQARLERERAAARPVIWLQGLAAACGLGLVVAAASFVRPWIAAAGGDVTSRGTPAAGRVVDGGPGDHARTLRPVGGGAVDRDGRLRSALPLAGRRLAGARPGRADVSCGYNWPCGPLAQW